MSLPLEPPAVSESVRRAAEAQFLNLPDSSPLRPIRLGFESSSLKDSQDYVCLFVFFSYFCKSQLKLEKLLEGLPASTNLLLTGEAQMFPRLALLLLPPGDVLLLRAAAQT